MAEKEKAPLRNTARSVKIRCRRPEYKVFYAYPSMLRRDHAAYEKGAAMKALVFQGIGGIQVQVQPISGALEAYEAFNARAEGWLKVQLEPAA
jgi:hypothetical protein